MAGPFRVISWLILGGLLCLVAGPMTFEVWESRIEPRTFASSDLEKFGDVSELSPPMRRLVEAIKQGKVLGAQVDAFRGDLEQADEIQTGKRTTRYLFLMRPEAGRQEFNIELTFAVQNKYGQIYYVDVVDPCF